MGSELKGKFEIFVDPGSNKDVSVITIRDSDGSMAHVHEGLVQDYILDQQVRIEELEARERVLVEALEFYGSWETWFATSLFPDRPAGEINNDYGFDPEDHDEERARPGERARQALGVTTQEGLLAKLKELEAEPDSYEFYPIEQALNTVKDDSK